MYYSRHIYYSRYHGTYIGVLPCTKILHLEITVTLFECTHYSDYINYLHSTISYMIHMMIQAK